MKLSIQLYSLREECAKDFIGALEYVAKLGFQGVEFAGYYGLSAEKLRSHLDRLGLTCSSAHVPAQEVLEKPDETIAFHQALGCKYIIIPWYDMKDAGTAAEFAEKIVAVKARYEASGLLLGYHNHGMEFQTDNGKYLLDHLMDRVGRKIVMELDTYWSTVAGADTPRYMLDNQDILALIHLKDGDGKQLASIGEGTMDIQRVLDTAEKIGVDWVVIENDEPQPNGFEDAARSVKNLKKYRTALI